MALFSWIRSRLKVSGLIAQRDVIALAWPIVCTMLGETLMGLVDTKLVSHLGPAALAGVAIGQSVLHLTLVTWIGMVRGIKICAAHAIGERRSDDARRFAKVGIAAGLVLGSLATLLLLGSRAFLPLLHLDPALLPAAQKFLFARAFGMPAAFAVAALIEYQQGIGQVRAPMVIGLLANLLNGFLAYGLINGEFGFPKLGVAGAGLGTMLTEWSQALALGFFYLRHERRGRAIGGEDLLFARSPLRRTLAELSSIGAPTALHFFCEYMAFVTCTGLLAQINRVEVAAHQIAVVINRIAYLPGLAIGEVACIMVSQALGAKRPEAAERAVRSALGLGVAFMIACGAGFVVYSDPLARFFSDDPSVISRVKHVLWIAGFFQVLDATNVVMRGALRGARDVRLCALIGAAILWTCVPSLTWFLGIYLGWGVLGAWCSFVVQGGLCALVFSRRWFRNEWRVGAIAENTLTTLHP